MTTGEALKEEQDKLGLTEEKWYKELCQRVLILELYIMK